MKIPIKLSRKKSAYSVYVYGALDVRLFPNKRLNVDLKNIEIWVSHGLRLNSGVAYVFSDAHCIDEDGGYVFWDVMPEDVCGINKYTRLYEGKMHKIYEPDKGRTMYSLETEDITFALWKKGEH